MDSQTDVEVKQAVVSREGTVRNRGKTKRGRSVAHDAVAKLPSGDNNGGNWVIVADKVEISISFNF